MRTGGPRCLGIGRSLVKVTGLGMAQRYDAPMKSDPKARSNRDGLKFSASLALIVIVGAGVAYQFVGPPPPRELIMASGVDGGAYRAFGTFYARELSGAGVELDLLSTAGSVENYELLRSGDADLAMVQGGTAPADVDEFAKGLASVFFEPLWIFSRSELEWTRLAELRGMRIQVGAEGSGTRAVAMDLLAANGIDAQSAELLGDEAGTAVDSLLSDQVDALLLISGPHSEQISRLMELEGGPVRLADVERHLAYVRTYSYLSHVVLPQGGLDLERNVPDRNVNLVAPTAVIVARKDIHQALVPLVIQAAEQVHGGGDLLAAANSFPSPRYLAAPLAPAADNYFRNGLSFLYRVFPFGVAATLDRLKILLLPLLTLLFPLVRMAPPLYRWRIRRKVFRWYGHLQEIERNFESDRCAHADCLGQLGRVEAEIVETVDVPASYMEELHNLRMHLERVRARIERWEG